MRTYGYILCIVYLVLKTYARFYLYQSVHARPAMTRSNEALQIMDVASWLALSGAFFFILRPERPLSTIILTVVLAVYDPVARFVFLRMEVRRMQLQSPNRKWHYRDARRHVRRRAVNAMFH